MPFTASHPAAIVPLRWLGLPTSALVIGSVVPDLPYFLPLPLAHAQTHSVVGVVSVDVLLGLATFVVWHSALVAPLVWASPAELQRRIPTAWRAGAGVRLSSPAAVASVVAALALGALLHVAWDAFTHAGMWGVRNWPWLETPVLGLASFRWLHLLSSAIGLLVLAWAVARWWRRSAVTAPVSLAPAGARLWLHRVLAFWLALATLEMVLGLLRAPSHFLREQVLVTGLTDFLGGLIPAAIAGAAAWHVVRARRPQWVGPGAASPSPADQPVTAAREEPPIPTA